MIDYLNIFLLGLILGLILGMFRMTFYYTRRKKRRIDCMTCLYFDRWSDSCPFCRYLYDKDTDCEQRVHAGVIEK